VAALVAAAAWLWAAPAGAALLGLSPSAVSPAPGGSFAVDLMVSGLEGKVVGAFDITLGFEATALAIASVSFDTQLGAIPAEATAEAVEGAGTLALSEVSILSTTALDGLQGDPVRLATIVFDVISAQPSTIAITAALLGDGDGVRIGLDAPPGGTSVAPIPEPAGALLFALGVGVVARISRRRVAPG
jgi:hypothetical protein